MAEQLNLYRVKWLDGTGFDYYDSMIVAAETKIEARRIFPVPMYRIYDVNNNSWMDPRTGNLCDGSGAWFRWVDGKDINELVVTYIGVADFSIKKGVVLASFNAG